MSQALRSLGPSLGGSFSARGPAGRLTRGALALRTAGGGLFALAAAAALAPLLAPTIGRSLLASRASAALGAEVEIGAADLGWRSGRVVMEGIVVRKPARGADRAPDSHAAGAAPARADDVLTIAELEATIPGGLLRALAGGLFRGDAPPSPEAILARGVRLHAVRGPDGAFPLERLLSGIPASSARAAAGSPAAWAPPPARAAGAPTSAPPLAPPPAPLSIRIEASEILLEEGGARIAIPFAGLCSVESPSATARVVRIGGSLGSEARGSLALTLTADLAAETASLEAVLSDLAIRDGARSWLELERGEVRLRVAGAVGPRASPGARSALAGGAGTGGAGAGGAREPGGRSGIDGLEVERLDLLRPRLRAERRGDGRIVLLGLVFDPAELAREAPRLPGALSVLVRRARVRGGALAWRDEALPAPFAPFETNLELDGTVTHLSLGAAAPRPGAPPGTPGTFELSGRAPGLCESIRAPGILRPGAAGVPGVAGAGSAGSAWRAWGAGRAAVGASPAAPLAQGQLFASVRGLDLVRASGYMVLAGRIGASGGRVSLDARLDLEPERFLGFARLSGEGVALGGPGHISQVVPGAVPVSVERALELLRGADGRIELLVPLAGERDTGRLDVAGMAAAAVGDALSSALGRALRGGTGTGTPAGARR